jgi:hypothetical protein
MDTGAEQTAGMHGNGMVMHADTVQGLAVSADGFTLGFADFSTSGRPYVLADDLLADGIVAWQALPVPAGATEADGFEIRLTEGTARAGEESQLEFAVTRNGRPVELQFPTSRSYRLFLRFKVDGRVHTVAFTQEVSL